MSALEIAKRRAAEAEANRLKMPDIHRWVHIARGSFAGARVVHAEEAGVVKGRRIGDYDVTARDMVLFRDGKQVIWENKDAVQVPKYAGADFGKFKGKPRSRP